MLVVPTINIFWGIPIWCSFFSVNSITRYGTVIRHPSSTSQLNYSCDVPMKVRQYFLQAKIREKKKPAKRCMGRDDISFQPLFLKFFWGCTISSMKCQDLVKEGESLQFFFFKNNGDIQFRSHRWAAKLAGSILKNTPGLVDKNYSTRWSKHHSHMFWFLLDMP